MTKIDLFLLLHVGQVLTVSPTMCEGRNERDKIAFVSLCPEVANMLDVGVIAVLFVGVHPAISSRKFRVGCMVAERKVVNEPRVAGLNQWTDPEPLAFCPLNNTSGLARIGADATGLIDYFKLIKQCGLQKTIGLRGDEG